MAVLDGQITADGIGGMTEANRGNLSIGLWGYDPVDYLDLSKGQAGDTTIHQQRVIHNPFVSVRGLPAKITRHYKDDYYYRIHVNPNPLALGSLLSVESRYVYVWNAFFEHKTLNDITKVNAEGVDINNPEVLPTDYPPLAEKVYIVTVSLDGPVTINAVINFEFAVYTMPLSITGVRVTLWVWVPKHKYKETLEWMTNILQTRQGEQRIAYRDAPRQIFDFFFLRPPQEISQIKMVTDNWAFRQWGLPIWKEKTAGIDALAGATAIDFDTSYRDFRDLAIIWESAYKTEAMKITNVRPDGIDIDPGLGQSYSNAFVMPVKKAISPAGADFNRGQIKDWTDFSMSFEIVDDKDLSETHIVTAWETGISITSGDFYSPGNDYIYIAGVTGTAGKASQWPKTFGDIVTDTNDITYECYNFGYPQYRTYDVLSDGNLIIGDISEQIRRPLVLIDNGQGPVTIETTQDYSAFARTVGKYTSSLRALWAWRKWLHSRYGKQKAFWLPSWNKDIMLAAILYSGGTLVEIEPIGLTLHGQFPLDCMLKLKDGTVFFRRISGAEELSGGNERIAIDSAFPKDISPIDVDLWCLMDLVRFNSDKIELDHENPYMMETSIPIMRVPG